MEKIISIPTGDKYIQDSLYESYIDNKIANEARLVYAMKEQMVLTESDYSNISYIFESKLTDSIKSRWKKFVAFIKGMVARFMESISNILLDEREYLTKYKDIILKRAPKDDIEFSYTGDYEEAVKRLINTEIPLFDYEKYKDKLLSDNKGDLVKEIMKGRTGFTYNDAESLDDQFKDYFLVLSAGERTGKLSSLNMTNIYNFCYNFSKIKGIVDTDIKRLEASTRAIEATIKSKLADTPTEDPKTESAMLEAEDGESGGDKPKSTGLNISSSSNPVSKMGTSPERNTEDENRVAGSGATAAKNAGKSADDISKAATNWIEACRPLISAKLTACQQIAKDYMEFIRAHVRSYGGTDLKKDKTGIKTPDIASEYSKDSEKAKKDAENGGGDNTN